MHKQNYVRRAIVSPTGSFKSPMEVVEANGILLVEKVAILQAWEADERAAGGSRSSQKFRHPGEAGSSFSCGARVNLKIEPPRP